MKKFRIECQDCTVSRDYGAARLNAELAADKHSRQAHTVKIISTLNGVVKVEHVIEPDKILIPLVDADGHEVIPF